MPAKERKLCVGRLVFKESASGKSEPNQMCFSLFFQGWRKLEKEVSYEIMLKILI